MIKQLLHTKVGSAVAIASVVAAVGGIATVSATGPVANADPAGYQKDQCKDGGWQNFTNPDGTPMFKNQGECVAFFASGGKAGGNNSGNSGDNSGNTTSNTNNLSIENNQTATSGDAKEKSGDATASASTTVSIGSGQ